MAVGVPLDAHAAPPPETDPLALRGADLSYDRLGPVGSAAPRGGPRPLSAEAHVIFLNYGGATLSPAGFGEEDSRADASEICSEPISAYGEGAKQDASIQATIKDWDAFNVHIVSERPVSGDYTMNMVGMSSCAPVASGGGGVAPVDCGNFNPNNISFSFVASEQNWSADHVATVNSQEIAHTFGLDHVNYGPEIMNPTAGGVADPSFLDECHPLTGTVFCSDQHDDFCDAGGQNSVQELLSILGPKVVDTMPPAASISSPSDGSVLPAPATVTVVAEATDDVSVIRVELFVDGVDQATPLMQPPYSWTLADLEDGSYTFEVVAYDQVGNTGRSEPVSVDVGEAAGTDDAGESGEAADTDSMAEDGDGGSGCQFGVHPTSQGRLGLALVVLLCGLRATSRSDRPSNHRGQS